MSYLVLARKYRPQDFSAVAGQEHVTKTLMNSIRRDKVAHAIVLCGPRGVGKTSIARIFSKALNCAKGPSAEPCLQCANCEEIAAGRSLAVREIDGASHNSVDNVRDLIDSFRSLPPPGSRYKIYIIDEVHMLSTSAFNALLKSLEEPPPNTVFILATTEPHKIPDTVLSRCQRHDLRALPLADVEQQLKMIAKKEKIDADQEVFRLIARLSEGSMRDAQTLLDRIQSFREGHISAEDASKVLGVVERRVLARIAEAIVSRNTKAAIESLDGAFVNGLDPALFLKEFATFWRELLLARFAGEPALKDLGLSDEEAKEALQYAQALSAHDVQDLVTMVYQGCDAALRSTHPKYALEALVVRMATREPVKDLQELIEELKKQPQRGEAPRQENRTPAPQLAPRSALSAVPAGRSAAPAAQDARVAAAPAAPPRAAVRQAEQASAGSEVPLDWYGFVGFVAQGHSKILSEQLKRLSVIRFFAGELQCGGPEFTVSYFREKTNRDKLETALNAFAPLAGNMQWKLTFATSTNKGPATGSILEEEEKKKSAHRVSATEKVTNHPKIKSLQKFFPGSEIENIKLKED